MRSLPIFLTMVLIAAAYVYWRGWRQLRNTLPNLLSVWRLIAFVGGVVSLWIATASPLRALDHQLLTAHMTQHLILMTVAAPFILLGAPIIVLWRGLPQTFIRRVLGPFLQSAPADGFGRIVTHPVFCWL